MSEPLPIPCDAGIREKIARVEARQDALAERIDRSERYSDSAVRLAADGLGKHLDTLNGHQKAMADQQREFVARELYERDIKERDARITKLELWIANQQGRQSIRDAVILILATVITALPWAISKASSR